MKNFYFLSHDNFNPAFNLASEEFLLKNKKEYFIYLWINSPAVIVGVNQNAFSEVNLNFVNANNIPVIRRLTGGGAVYHDKNNICYTVIAPYNDGLDGYKAFITPVIEYLKSLGINALFQGRNDITVDGKKISGMAQTVVGDRILHHGTLLFDTDFTALEGALKPNKLKIESKGIKSVRARVTNIKSHLGSALSNMTALDFYNGLCKFLSKDLPRYNFTESDLKEINGLALDKYSNYAWNMGNSPKGNITVEKRYSFGTMTLNFNVKDGFIQDTSIFGDFFTIKDIQEFSSLFNGLKFNLESLTPVINRVGEFIKDAKSSEILESIFE
ncbi:MAG: lipoate--protein ligase [Clostridia bacterium]|nr:lipoate--protein ligase [Clostridia bacterium]